MLSLAWVIEVDGAQLATRLEAYVESQATVDGLEAALTSSALPRLLPEILDLIVEKLKDEIYHSRLPGWLRAQKCLKGECRIWNHDLREIVNMDGTITRQMSTEDPSTETNQQNRWMSDWQIHDQIVHQSRQRIHPSSKTYQEQCQAISDDFGLKLHFINNIQTSIRDGLFEVQPDEPGFLGFLVLPMPDQSVTEETSSTRTTNGVRMKRRSFAPDKVPDLSKDVARQFQKAIMALGLDTPHTQFTVEYAGELGRMFANSREPSESQVSLVDQGEEASPNKREECYECDSPVCKGAVSRLQTPHVMPIDA